MKPLALQSVRVKNFKAVRDSGTVKLTPLTVFIGNNGSGKSSVIEALETFQAVITDGLDQAMLPWHGFEHAWNQTVTHKLHRPGKGRAFLTNPMEFQVRGRTDLGRISAIMKISTGEGGNDLFIQHERITTKADPPYDPEYPEPVTDERDSNGHWNEKMTRQLADGESLFSVVGWSFDWQFLSMTAQTMGHPLPQRRAGGRQPRLVRDGSNIAEYLYSIYRTDLDAYNGILEAMRFVLPYARDLQPAITSGFERNVLIQLTEGEFKLPSWLLSTGTLRVLALLALLRHPKPPSLIVVEEIENGLDPRTVHLMLDEIREAVQSGKTQVIATTHSPYLLNLLPLQTILLVEREDSGSPTFWRPGDVKEVQSWAKQFAPGELYTTGRFKKGKRR